jgi:primary-amine oxidase
VTNETKHDHIITYKADFDILSTANSLQVSELQAVNVTQAWFPELGEFEQMEMNVYNMKQEKQFNYAPNNQAMYVVLNPNATNKWGEPRGYRIVPGRSDIHLSTLNSPWSLKNSEFAKSHLAVTRQHDTEPFANSVQNINLPSAPQQDFAKFFNGESVENEDLVVWFNLGMHHFTRYGTNPFPGNIC